MNTKIVVKVNPAAANLLSGEWQEIDLPKDFSLRYTRSVAALTADNGILMDAALSFDIDVSPRNSIIFMDFDSMSVLDLGAQYLECRVKEGDSEQVFDRMYFRGKGEQGWDFELRVTETHWGVAAQAKKLSTIELPLKTLDAAGVTTDWVNRPYVDGEDAARWAYIDYGGWVDRSEPIQFTDPPTKSIWLEDLRPIISVVALLKLGFCEIGYTIKGTLLDLDVIRCWYAYLLSSNYYVNSNGGSCKLVLEQNGGAFVSNPSNIVGGFFNLDTVVYDPGGHVDVSQLGGYTNPLPYKSKHSYNFSGRVKHLGATSQEGFASIMEIDDLGLLIPSGQIGETVSIGMFAPNEERFINITLEVDLEIGQFGFIGVGTTHFQLGQGFRVTVQPALQSLVRDDEFKPNLLIDNSYVLLDLFKGALHAWNAVPVFNPLTKEIEVVPQKTVTIDGVTIAGYYNETQSIEISDRVNDESVRFAPIKNDLKRNTLFQFKKSTDPTITGVSDTYNPHSRTIVNGIELPEGNEEITNPFFEPTIDRKSDVLKRNVTVPSPFLAALTDNVSGDRSFLISPRILFYHGRCLQKRSLSQTGSGNAALYFEGAYTALISYASQNANGIINTVNSPPPYPDETIVYGIKPDDLFVRFRLGATQYQRNGFKVDLLQDIRRSEFAPFDFSIPRTLNYKGIPVRLLPIEIRDFAPNEGTPTPVEYVAELQMSACCDNPCACVFKECDFYQDIGMYITQATLNTLRVTKFEVNGIEQLTAPVFLGLFNAIEVDNKSFVTNLIDALDSAKVPLFSYGYSLEPYAPKEDLRFFKMKYPACYSFKIEVSDNTEVKYRYTETLIEQKWFGGGFGAFGYAGNPISTPLRCVTTTEY